MVVKLDLTQEIEVFYIMFDRSLPIFTMTYSIKSSIKNTLNFRCKIQPDHTLYICRTAYLGLGVTPSSNACTSTCCGSSMRFLLLHSYFSSLHFLPLFPCSDSSAISWSDDDSACDFTDRFEKCGRGRERLEESAADDAEEKASHEDAAASTADEGEDGDEEKTATAKKREKDKQTQTSHHAKVEVGDTLCCLEAREGLTNMKSLLCLGGPLLSLARVGEMEREGERERGGQRD